MIGATSLEKVTADLSLARLDPVTRYKPIRNKVQHSPQLKMRFIRKPPIKVLWNDLNDKPPYG
jgi:hypothetical protein